MYDRIVFMSADTLQLLINDMDEDEEIRWAMYEKEMLEQGRWEGGEYRTDH